MVFCKKCGCQLLPDDVFCSNCGERVPIKYTAQNNAGAPGREPEQNVQVKNAGATAGDSAGKKYTGWIIALAAVLATVLAVLLGTVTFFGISMWKNRKQATANSDSFGETKAAVNQTNPEGTDDPEREDNQEDALIIYGRDDLPRLILYADKSLFYADEEKDITLTVRVPSDLSFQPIWVIDEEGKEITGISEDKPTCTEADYREYTTPLHLPAGEPGVLTLTGWLKSCLPKAKSRCVSSSQ